MSVERRTRLRLESIPEFVLLFRAVLEMESRAVRGVFDGTEKTLRQWVEAFYSVANRKLAEDALDVVRPYGEKISAAALAEIAAPDTPFDLDVLVTSYAAGLATRWTDDSVSQWRAMLRDEAEEDLGELLGAKLESWESRPQLAGEREATQAGSAFVKVPFMLAGVKTMQWVALGESCPLCQMMNGRTVAIDRPFLEPGDKVDPGGDTSPLVAAQSIGHPPLHGLGGRGGVCDCLLISSD